MAMETHVFFRGKLPSKAALTRAMKELGFPLAIKPATGSLEQQTGFMPMTLWREETGAEFDVYNDHSAVEEFADAGVDPSFERRASFRWGGSPYELAAGLCGTAALAKLVNGVAFDPQEDRLLSVDDAIETARRYLDKLPKPAKTRSRYSPRAIKRVLAPLLAKRDDLALVDRLLVVRPVRHLIRGALFRWDRGSLLAYPYLRPLYAACDFFLVDAAFSSSLSNPYLEPLLFDELAVNVFTPLGKIATINDYVDAMEARHRPPDELLPSILLSHGIEWATDYLARSEKARDEPVYRISGQRALMDRGDAAVFAHYRAWETAIARGFRIEHIWEQTPFPAELPTTRRAEMADRIFIPSPWLEFPTTWRADPPAEPGEVRFGCDWQYRHGKVMLLYPVSREQAEEKFRDYKPYLLMVRLSQRQLLALWYTAHPSFTPDGSPIQLAIYHLWIYGLDDRCMTADFDEAYDDPGILKMRRIEVKGTDYWLSQLNFKRNEKAIWKSGEFYASSTLTVADRAAYAFPLPGFGEFEGLWQRISMYLRNEGFGEFV